MFFPVDFPLILLVLPKSTYLHPIYVTTNNILLVESVLFSLWHPCRMLEYGEYKGHLYGTSVDAVQTVLDEGKICVMDLEPQVGLWWNVSHLPKGMNEYRAFCVCAVGCS